MRSHVLIETGTQKVWLYAPDAHIQFRIYQGGSYGLVIAAFRTDGYHRSRGNAIPTVRWLRENNAFVGELDVPDDIVEFAVRSEKERQESVQSIESFLNRAASSGERPSWEKVQESLQSPSESREADEILEYRYALKLQELLVPFEGQG